MTPDGRWAVVVVNALPTGMEMVAAVSRAVDAALCAPDLRPSAG